MLCLNRVGGERLEAYGSLDEIGGDLQRYHVIGGGEQLFREGSDLGFELSLPVDA